MLDVIYNLIIDFHINQLITKAIFLAFKGLNISVYIF